MRRILPFILPFTRFGIVVPAQDVQAVDFHASGAVTAQAHIATDIASEIYGATQEADQLGANVKASELLVPGASFAEAFV